MKSCQRKRFSLIFALATCMGLVSCHSKTGTSEIKATKVDMKEFGDDLVVPNALWKKIESLYRPLALDAEGKSVKEGAQEGEGKSENKSDDKKGNKEVEDLLKKRPPLDPIAITVYLVEKTEGVLGGQNYALTYPTGGGILDYRAFVPETKEGTFFLKVVYAQEMDPKDTHVYYLSNARVRDVDGKPMGSGCSRYFDISQYWKSQMKGDGLALNTVSLRHVSVTAGTLFFVAPYRGKLRMAHLTIKDSRHRNLMCSSEVHDSPGDSAD